MTVIFYYCFDLIVFLLLLTVWPYKRCPWLGESKSSTAKDTPVGIPIEDSSLGIEIS